MVMNYTKIPQKNIGPLSLSFAGSREEVYVPLATFESPLWPSVGRGAKLSRLSANGIECLVVHSSMTRSIVLQAQSAVSAYEFVTSLSLEESSLSEVVRKTSNYCTYESMHVQIVGSSIFIRFSFKTGQASGHNMATKAAEALQSYILSKYKQIEYVSISGNLCCDKKASSVNGILGRGKYTIAQLKLTPSQVEKHLRTTCAKLIDLNWKKNHLGTNLAGTIRSANAHFANMLLAIYLATGQDAANIIEGSQGFTTVEMDNDGLLSFSVTLPNLIVGTVGNGKDLPDIQNNLSLLGCSQSDRSDAGALDDSSERLAKIIAAVVLCGELSLLAAQTNPGELMKSHLQYERKKEAQAL